MAKITDYNDLNSGTEIVYRPNDSPPTIQLVVAGNLSSDGVSIAAVYRAWKRDQRVTAALRANYPAFAPVFDESFRLTYGWEWYDATTLKLLRDGGCEYRTSANALAAVYACILGLGTIEDASNVYCYYELEPGVAVDFAYPGEPNELIQVYGDATHGDFDYRDAFSVFVRPQGQKFDRKVLFDSGATALTSRKLAFALSSIADAKVLVEDTGIDANDDGTADVTPYSLMDWEFYDQDPGGAATGYAEWSAGAQPAGAIRQSATDGRWYRTVAGGTSSGDDTDLLGGSDVGVTWVRFAGERELSTGWAPFIVAVDATAVSSPTNEQIYTFANWVLRKSTDIDDGARVLLGKLSQEWVEFIGDTLWTKSGVFVDGLSETGKAAARFRDVREIVGQELRYPPVSVVTFDFDDIIQADSGAIYEVVTAASFGTASPVIVLDKDSAPMSGNVSGAASIQHTYAWSGDLNIVIIVSGSVPGDGSGSAEVAFKAGTIHDSITDVVSVSSRDDNVA